jgi:hypothetical protein
LVNAGKRRRLKAKKARDVAGPAAEPAVEPAVERNPSGMSFSCVAFFFALLLS